MPRCWCGSPPLTDTTLTASATSLTHLLSQQLDDGGWNCAARGERGKHSSFHTTIQALEALHTYQQAGEEPTKRRRPEGGSSFSRHRLYKSHRTGEVAIRGSTRFPQLPQWHFDVLRGLEYFVDVAAEQDERLEDAIAVVRHARRGGRPLADVLRLSRPYAGFGWKNRVQAGGTPCERFGS